MRARVSEDSVEVLLAPWEKALGLMGDIRVPLEEVSDPQVVADPMRQVMRLGIKVGLRLPWLYFVARTLRLDEAWLVRRGVPALSFSVSNHRRLRRVVVSTPDAEELARCLAPSPGSPSVAGSPRVAG
jgi:hypothetical protein